MSESIKVRSASEAWAKANELFPTDYNLDSQSSERAGYPVYRSSVNRYDYICDLGARLEINLSNGETINVWIEEPETPEESAPAEMYEYTLTIGLFDKDSESQEVSDKYAKRIIAEILIEKHGIFAYTMLDCHGVYRMQSSGRVVSEPSIRLEIATDSDIGETINEIIKDLKKSLNQETIMLKQQKSMISF